MYEFSLQISKPIKHHHKSFLANVAEEYQKYFCIEKVVVKKVTGWKPGCKYYRNRHDASPTDINKENFITTLTEEKKHRGIFCV